MSTTTLFFQFVSTTPCPSPQYRVTITDATTGVLVATFLNQGTVCSSRGAPRNVPLVATVTALTAGGADGLTRSIALTLTSERTQVTVQATSCTAGSQGSIVNDFTLTSTPDASCGVFEIVVQTDIPDVSLVLTVFDLRGNVLASQNAAPAPPGGRAFTRLQFSSEDPVVIVQVFNPLTEQVSRLQVGAAAACLQYLASTRRLEPCDGGQNSASVVVIIKRRRCGCKK